MSVLEASWEHHGSTTLLSRPACQGLAPVLILGLGQAEESPPPDPLMEGWVLDPQHQRGAFRCSRDPQLWAFGGSRSHRTCLTSCSSQTHWHFFFSGRPPQLLAASQRGGRGRGMQGARTLAATPRGPSDERGGAGGGRRQVSPPRVWTSFHLRFRFSECWGTLFILNSNYHNSAFDIFMIRIFLVASAYFVPGTVLSAWPMTLR